MVYNYNIQYTNYLVNNINLNYTKNLQLIYFYKITLLLIAISYCTLSVNHPVRSSFKVYAEEILGPFMGFYVCNLNFNSCLPNPVEYYFNQRITLYINLRVN